MGIGLSEVVEQVLYVVRFDNKPSFRVKISSNRIMRRFPRSNPIELIEKNNKIDIIHKGSQVKIADQTQESNTCSQ